MMARRLAPVPDSDAKHPAEPAGKVDAEPLVKMGQDYGIAAGRQEVAVAPQFVAEPCMVVELAVLYCNDGSIFVHHGLMAAGDVDDAQSTNAECYAVGCERPPVIRTTVGHRIRHQVEVLGRDGRRPVGRRLTTPRIPHI